MNPAGYLVSLRELMGLADSRGISRFQSRFENNSSDRITHPYAVEPYIADARRKGADEWGLLFTSLGKHLAKKRRIDGALIVGASAGVTADNIPAVEHPGLRGRRTLI